MDENEFEEITEEVGWENIDKVVQQFLDGKTIAEIRAITLDQFPDAAQNHAGTFCGYYIECKECPLHATYPGQKDYDYCAIAIPCSPEEFADLI